MTFPDHEKKRLNIVLQPSKFNAARAARAAAFCLMLLVPGALLDSWFMQFTGFLVIILTAVISVVWRLNDTIGVTADEAIETIMRMKANGEIE